MDEYEIIKRASAVLAATPERTASKNTVAEYIAIFKRLRKLMGDKATEANALPVMIELAKDTEKASTWFKRRAALIYCTRYMLKRTLAEQDALLRKLREDGAEFDSPATEEWRRSVQRVARIVADLEVAQSESGPPEEMRKRREGKRKALQGLPADWREKLVERLPKYRQAVLANAVTGCRPNELVKGVKFLIEGDYLIAEIEGAKVTEKSGQPWRRMAWQIGSDSPLVCMMVEEVRAGLSVARIVDARRYSGAVRAAGGRAWPTRAKTITPYCFRHAAASDMKAAALDGAVISAALGHCEESTKTRYGTRGQGRRRGGAAPKLVEAARPVRVAMPEPMQNEVESEPASRPGVT